MPYKSKEDQKEASRRHYLLNKKIINEKSAEQRRSLREKVKGLKESKPCVDCNTLYPYYVMQYDHINDDKVLSISSLIRCSNWKSVELEIAKCELVCANCHAVRTYNRITRKMSPDGDGATLEM
jgi:hypothetical protein